MGNLKATLRRVLVTSLSGVLFAAVLPGCDEQTTDASGSKSSLPPMIQVLRVESQSAERAGGEHCESTHQNCVPLAPGQQLPRKGLVRTFAGGKVSLDFGAGHRVDVGELSETTLDAHRVGLGKGDFSIESSPLIGKETLSPLSFSALGRTLTLDPDQEGAMDLLVKSQEAQMTFRRGDVSGLDIPGLDKSSPREGQTVRLTSAQVFRTAASGRELAPLVPTITRRSEYGELLSGAARGPRGLGTMSARLPNTSELREGVTLKRHHVNVVVRDGYAQTTVEEEFENHSPQILEGRYRFPIPADASLSRLALWVGDKLIEGEVLERKRAATIYSSIVDRPAPRDPALLEWVSGGEMSLKVFPLLPKKTRRVVLAYDQALSTEGDRLRYVYPLSLGEARENLIEDLSISVRVHDSTADSRALRTLGYDAEFGSEGAWKTASFTAKNISPSADFVLLVDRIARPEAELSYSLSRDDTPSSPLPPTSQALGQFALRVTVDLPEGMTRPPTKPLRRAIVLDISQSQSKDTIRAQGALAFSLLRDAGSGERALLLACDSACDTFHVSTPKQPRKELLAEARDWLENLEPGGASDIAGALTAAALQLNASKNAENSRPQLVYLGDGKASSGELTAGGIARRVATQLTGTELRLIGAGRTVDLGALQALGAKLGASVDSLRTGGSLENRIAEIAAGLRAPILRDVRLQLPSSLRAEGARALPALRLGQQLRLTGELLSLEGGQVTLKGELSGGPYQLTREVAFRNGKDAQNPLIGSLYAREKILRLEGEEVTPVTTREIVKLSTKYRVMSRYTSFLVLESDKMFADHGVERTASAPPQDSFSFSAADQNEGPRLSLPAEKLELSREQRESWSLDEEEPAAVANSRPRPRPSPKPASAPRRKSMVAKRRPSSAGPLGGLSSDSSVTTKGSQGSGSESTAKGAAERSYFREPPPWQTHRAPIRRRRAHLVHESADDAWRKWGEKSLSKRRSVLDENPKSRANLTAFIREHLKYGRFQEARRVADDFVRLDPDHAEARELLSYASVVTGDHELARKMLDAQAETSPRDLVVHARAARAFDAVGDEVRACSHFRALAELSPDLGEAKNRAESCWRHVTGRSDGPATRASAAKPGQLDVEVVCDDDTRPEDCPSPVIVAPDGAVVSPWTPGTGRATRQQVGFVKLRTGDYFILVSGGAPSASGKVVLKGRHEAKAFRFEAGAMQTVARTRVTFW